jgi:FkbM family methyltransferase
MITVTYNSEGIKVNVGHISKYNPNLPLRLKIKKHVSGEEQWATNLNDNWYATYPNTEMFDVEIYDSKDRLVYCKRWDVMEHGNHFYKSLWMYNKKVLSQGKLPKGLVIGTHDGEFGEWVPIVEKRECSVVLVEASDKQFQKLKHNYRNNSLVKPIQNLITPNGGEVEFFEGGEGYTNTVVENVIRHWEKEEIKSTKRDSISITDLILTEFGGHIDWIHLDVEGLDAQLIMGIDEKKVSLPNFIIFEDYNLTQDKKDEIYSWLQVKGYVIYSEKGICEAIMKKN